MKNENFCIHPIKYLITSVFLILHASATTSGSLANVIVMATARKKNGTDHTMQNNFHNVIKFMLL